MKPISHGHYALSACAAVAVLSGCGGATQFQNPTTSPSIAGSTAPTAVAAKSNASGLEGSTPAKAAEMASLRGSAFSRAVERRGHIPVRLPLIAI